MRIYPLAAGISALAAGLLLAGCGGGPGATNNGASADQIARLSAPKVEHVDLQAPARIQALTPGDLEAAGLVHICDFSRDDVVYLSVSAGDALARVASNLRHFTHSSPTGPTGGFYEDRQISISVGRTGAVTAEEHGAGAWPARLRVTNRRANVQVTLEGTWRCFS